MAGIEFDMTRYKMHAQDVKKNIDEFNILINNFYKRIQQIPTKSGEWYGTSALKFVSLINPEYTSCNNFVDKLYSFSNLMLDFADEMVKLEQNNKVGGNK